MFSEFFVVGVVAVVGLIILGRILVALQARLQA